MHIEFVSIYVREAHPGEKHPHHTSAEQKMSYARAWKSEDQIAWTVAVDQLEGPVHQAYGSLPNSFYLIDRTGHLSFRALWAGQEKLLRKNIEVLLEREGKGEDPVVLGQRENLLIPLLKGGTHFEQAMNRGGEKSRQDFKREMGGMAYGMQNMLSKLGSK